MNFCRYFSKPYLYFWLTFLFFISKKEEEKVEETPVVIDEKAETQESTQDGSVEVVEETPVVNG